MKNDTHFFVYKQDVTENSRGGSSHDADDVGAVLSFGSDVDAGVEETLNKTLALQDYTFVVVHSALRNGKLV